MDHSTERDGDSIANGVRYITVHCAWRAQASGGEGGERGRGSCGRERLAGERLGPQQKSPQHQCVVHMPQADSSMEATHVN